MEQNIQQITQKPPLPIKTKIAAWLMIVISIIGFIGAFMLSILSGTQGAYIPFLPFIILLILMVFLKIDALKSVGHNTILFDFLIFIYIFFIIFPTPYKKKQA